MWTIPSKFQRRIQHTKGIPLSYNISSSQFLRTVLLIEIIHVDMTEFNISGYYACTLYFSLIYKVQYVNRRQIYETHYNVLKTFSEKTSISKQQRDKQMQYLRTHTRIPTTVMTLPESNVPHTCYWNEHLLVCCWTPIQWIAVHIQIRVHKWPQWHSFLLHTFRSPFPVTA